MDFDKIGKSYKFSFDLYPKGDAKSEDDIALYIKAKIDDVAHSLLKIKQLHYITLHYIKLHYITLN
jgi:hypothetical protein